MKYSSDSSCFCTDVEVFTNLICLMNKDEVEVFIHIDKDWAMSGVISKTSIMYKLRGIEELDNEECEKLLVSLVPHPSRTDVLEEHNIDCYDTIKLLAITRGIVLWNDDWVRFTASEKYVDFHPRGNKKIMEEYNKTLEVLD